MAAKKKATAKSKAAKPAKKKAAPKRAAAKPPKKSAKETATSAKKKSALSPSVIYTDLRRTVSSSVLGRLLGS
jgi:type IV secretory pathway VirB9-like protein